MIKLLMKDMNQILEAKKYFELVIKNYPKTSMQSSRFKLDYITEIMASKEMYLARYYVQREKWIPQLKDFKLL